MKIFISIFILFSTITTAQALAADLNGIWQKSCVRGVKRTEHIQQNFAALDEDYHHDHLCQGDPVLRFTSDGPFTLSEPNKIDFTFAHVFATVFSEKTASDYNARAVCGFLNWKLNQPYDVTGRKCAFFGGNLLVQMPAQGRQVYGIWSIDADKLFFGKISRDFDGSSSERRPHLYDPEPYVRIP